ncbi:MAG: glycosyltransferase family A protein [Nannocystaceae bacterium]
MHPVPRVSVVVPMYNRERYVQAALASVLAQTRAADEIIVVDDGSVDQSCARVKALASPIIRIIRQENGGIGSARNTGIAHCTGDVVTFVDSDDLWEPRKLEQQLAAQARHPQVDLFFGHLVEFVDRASVDVEAARATKHEPRPARGTTGAAVEGWLALTMMASRASLDRVGLFSTETNLGEFIDWFHRARTLGLRSHLLPQVLARRRIHDSNTVSTENPADYLRVLRRAIVRRREAEQKASRGRVSR